MHFEAVLYVFFDDGLEKHVGPSSIIFDVPLSGWVVFSLST